MTRTTAGPPPPCMNAFWTLSAWPSRPGALPPGSRLTLEGLQQEYGISRTVARDTMKVLESMNLVYSRRRVGIVVQATDALERL